MADQKLIDEVGKYIDKYYNLRRNLYRQEISLQ